MTGAGKQNGTNDLHGTVCDCVSRIPLPGVTITLSGNARNLSARTDQTGAFRLTSLPLGVYDLDLQHTGYAGGLQNATVTVAVPPEPLSLCLVPVSDIEGIVLGAEDQPLAGVQIYARQKGGHRSTTATSDSEGRYRITALNAGIYQIAWRVPYEVRKQTVARDPSADEVYGYHPLQYYPGVDEPRLATTSAIAGAGQTYKLDVHLRRTLLVGFSGHIVDTAGKPSAGASVRLAANTGAGDESIENAVVDERGQFGFDLIAPGRYDVAISRVDFGKLPYFATVDVPRSGTADAEIRVPSYQTITMTIKPPDPQTRWEGTFEIQVRSWINKMGYPLGSFDGSGPALASVPPGQWRFEIRARDLRQLGDRTTALYIADLRFGNQSARGAPVRVFEGGNPPLEIILTDQVGAVDGIVAKEE
jgi:5-hydroxyisourate hydrolase-like protein (transthyretin family)